MLLSGIIDMENGNFASAAQTFERLAALQPDNKRVRDLLARALSLGRSDRELIYRYGKVARAAGASPYLQTLMARSHAALDEWEEAGELLDLAAAPRSGNLVALKGEATIDVAEARGHGSGSDALQLTRARIMSRNPSAAIAATEGFLDRFRGSADALVLAGDANLAARRYARAARYYELASQIRRPWPVVRKHYAALQGTGRSDAAMILLARYFVGDPGNVEAADMLAREAAQRDDWEAAAVFADHAVENGGARDPALLARQAEIELRLGEDAVAEDLAMRAYQLQPQNRQALRALIDVLEKREDRKDAAADLRRKLSLLQN